MTMKKTVALVCFEHPDSAVGKFAAHAARLLSAGGHTSMLFTRLPMAGIPPDVTVHTIGESDDEDLIGRVRAFTLRASAAFGAAMMPGADIVLLGCEWSSIPALQILN